MDKRLSYQLTQAMIELALGRTTATAKTLEKMQGKQVNPSFKLFSQFSLSAAQGNCQDVTAFIEQRMLIHQDKTRYAGAYLLALEQLGDDEKAYKEFLRLRPKLAQNILNQEAQNEISITAKNRYLLTYFVQLHTRRNKMQSISNLALQLDESFAQGDTPQDIYYARWLLFRQQKEQAKAMILDMMNKGWLPDYNASQYPETITKQLFIDVGLDSKTYQDLLNKNRAQVITEFE